MRGIWRRSAGARARCGADRAAGRPHADRRQHRDRPQLDRAADRRMTAGHVQISGCRALFPRSSRSPGCGSATSAAFGSARSACRCAGGPGRCSRTASTSKISRRRTSPSSACRSHRRNRKPQLDRDPDHRDRSGVDRGAAAGAGSSRASPRPSNARIGPVALARGCQRRCLGARASAATAATNCIFTSIAGAWTGACRRMNRPGGRLENFLQLPGLGALSATATIGGERAAEHVELVRSTPARCTARRKASST
jgi:hypothetical protein